MLPRACRFAANNAIALVALFLAVGGASYAATGAFKASSATVYKACVGESRVVVLKTGGKPCHKGQRTIVWNQEGLAGAKGAAGATGAAGANGANGANGTNGFSALSTLPSGASESGDYSVSSGGIQQLNLNASYTFPIPLAAPIDEKHVEYTGSTSTTSECPGIGKAAKGWLCVYTVERKSIELVSIYSDDSGTFTKGTGRYGFDLEWAPGAAEAFDVGSWTVTAP